MSAENANPDAGFTLVGWDAEGRASFEATGGDRRAVLEAALSALLVLAGGKSAQPGDDRHVRSAPIRGEGDDLALLFTDLADDLLDQADFFGADLQDVTLDGLTRREDGGFVAWGYVRGTPGSGGSLTLLSLNGSPTVSELGPTRIVIRASLVRGGESPHTRPLSHSDGRGES